MTIDLTPVQSFSNLYGDIPKADLPIHSGINLTPIVIVLIIIVVVVVIYAVHNNMKIEKMIRDIRLMQN